MENKSKFGLTAGLMGALVYLIGGFNSTALVILFVAIALWEENEFVKVCAKRVAVLFLAYQILDYAITGLRNLFGIISSGLFSTLLNKIDSIVYVAYIVLIIFYALKALINPVVTESILDKKAVDKVTDVVSNVATNVSAKMGTKTCPKCGKTVSNEAGFCTGCGEKLTEE